MHALVTGCCGLIGSHLVERLLADDWSVAGIDDLSVGSIKHAPVEHAKFDFVHAPCARALKRRFYVKFDAIFHLAARLGPAQVVADPLTMLTEGYEDTLAACELAESCGAVLVLASSSEVYQYNEKLPYREDDPTLLGPSRYPRTGYAVSKLMTEHLGLAYHRQHGVKTIITRFFNVVGARQAPRFVLPIFARQCLTGGRMVIHGDGMQWRTFSYVRDAVDALVALAANPDAIGQVVNVGARQPNMTVGLIAREIRGHCHLRYRVPLAPLDFVPYSTTGDAAWEGMRDRVPDTRKLEKLTGLQFPNRWQEIVSEVCADQAAGLRSGGGCEVSSMA